MQTRLHLLLTLRLIAQFTKLSGGLEGGSDPPAFQRAEKKRLEAAKRAEEAAAAKEAALEESLCDTQNSEVESAMTPRKVLYRLACLKFFIFLFWVVFLRGGHSRCKVTVPYSLQSVCEFMGTYPCFISLYEN